jgi:hypothetical protein
VLTTAPPRLFFFWLRGHRCFGVIKVRGDRGGVGGVQVGTWVVGFW